MYLCVILLELDEWKKCGKNDTLYINNYEFGVSLTTHQLYSHSSGMTHIS